MIRSMLKQLQQGERDQSLLSFIDRAMKVEEHKKLLESHYSQELSLLYILQEDFDRAKYYIKRAMELFIEVRVFFFFFSSELYLSLWSRMFTPSCLPTELLQCGHAAHSKSAHRPSVSAVLNRDPGLPALHYRGGCV